MPRRDIKIVDSLGRGAFAEVFKVELRGDSGFIKKAALKKSLQALSPAEQATFEQEAKLLASFRHPNIVDVFDYWIEDSKPCILEEYVSGLGLNQFYSEKNVMQPFEASEVCELLKQGLRGLKYLHEQIDEDKQKKVIHLDISPHNIKIENSGNLKILDFGCGSGGWAIPLAKSLQPIA